MDYVERAAIQDGSVHETTIQPTREPMSSEQLLFARTHEWVRLEADASGDKVAVVGITDFAVKAMSDITHLELPEAGRTVAAGEPFGEIESVKAVSDLYAPVGGEIVEVHGELSDELEVVSDDPFGRGWLIKIRITEEESLNALLDRAAYDKQCAEEMDNET